VWRWGRVVVTRSDVRSVCSVFSSRAGSVHAYNSGVGGYEGIWRRRGKRCWKRAEREYREGVCRVRWWNCIVVVRHQRANRYAHSQAGQQGPELSRVWGVVVATLRTRVRHGGEGAYSEILVR